jgi:hypothetical protein
MFVSVIHRISDPDAFWTAAAGATNDISANLKLHQTAPGKDRSASATA